MERRARRAKVAAVSVGLVDGVPLLDLDYSRGLARRGRLQRGRHGRAARTSSSRARPRASRSTGRRWTTLLDLADDGLQQLFAAQREVARAAVRAVTPTRLAGRHALGAQARASCGAARARPGRGAGLAGRCWGSPASPIEDGETFEANAADQGPLLRAAHRPAHARRRLRPRGRRARRRPGRADPALRRRGRHRRREQREAPARTGRRAAGASAARATCACWPWPCPATRAARRPA